MQQTQKGGIASCILVIGILLVIAGCSNAGSNLGAGSAVMVCKSPNCACCNGHVAQMEKEGFDVNVVAQNNLASLKEEKGIPQSMRSCHTSVIDGYIIEGHVPPAAIDKLLSERPDIDGIALPGMPAGVAGMPGIKNREWVIYAIDDGSVEEFMRI